jgi:hypothetical protein
MPLATLSPRKKESHEDTKGTKTHDAREADREENKSGEEGGVRPPGSGTSASAWLHSTTS